MTHDSRPSGEQPGRPRQDDPSTAPAAEPSPAVSGPGPREDVDDEGYDPDHFEDL